MIWKIQDSLISSGIIPDFILHKISKRLCSNILKREHNYESLKQELMNSEISTHCKESNEQHYEVPSKFFELVLGKKLKYSCALFDGTDDLDEAEEKMLELTCKRAQLQDGQDILELGCGWGSLTLYMAHKYPNSKILAVSNSSTQKEYIMSKAPSNVSIITCDVAKLELDTKFDRIVSIEMFEHIRNYPQLFEKLSKYCKDKMFIHVFGHNKDAFLYKNGWMTRNFFSGGTMLNKRLLPDMAKGFFLIDEWKVDGTHYAKTSQAWLDNMYSFKKEVISVVGKKQFNNWRAFFIAVIELFGFNEGKEWQVYHYLFKVKKKCE